MEQTPEELFLFHQDSQQRHVESSRRTTGTATLEANEVNTDTRHTARRSVRRN
jgi:hypothetical protein